MVDIGSAVFAELDLERDRPAAGRAQPPDILSDQPFGRRDRISCPVDGDAFLEVEVDRMVPASTAVDIGPVLDVARLRVEQRDAVGVHRVRFLPVDPDGPREHRGLRAIGRALAGDGIARVALARTARFGTPSPARTGGRY